MDAVILAGGKGTRLRPFTTTLPKPLLPVRDKPVVSIVIQQLREAGVKRVVLAVNHMAELIMSFFGTGSKYGVEIEYSVEDKSLGTVAPLKLIDNLPDSFLVMNGDILTDIDYKRLYCAHLTSGAALTIAAYRRHVPIDFGVLKCDRSQRLVGFEEKPTFSFDVSMGIYVFRKSILEYVPRNVPFGFDQLVKELLSAGEFIHIHQHSGYWLDLGRPDDYDRANEDERALAIAM